MWQRSFCVLVLLELMRLPVAHAVPQVAFASSGRAGSGSVDATAATNDSAGQVGEEGVPTKVRVRAVSRDAKVIGTKVGGARIRIRNARSGEILAEGVQMGGTGDTQRIMVTPRERFATVYATAGTAEFMATLYLKEPTLVEITAEGPLGYPQATRSTSKTLLLIPGKDVLGEGVLLEIHGFIVEILSPAAPQARRGDTLTIRARLTMT